MDFTSHEYTLETIVKPSFPQATDIRILENKKIQHLINFSSHITHLTVEFRQNGETKIEKLVLKSPLTRPLEHSFCRELKLYYKEQQIYNLMIPRLHKIPTVSHILPVHYLVKDEGIFVLEDLAAKGYSTPPKRFELAESRCILRAMAKFHAATHKVHRQSPELLQEAAFHRTIALDTVDIFKKPWQPVICELLERKNGTHLVPKVEAAMRFLGQDNRALYSMVQPAHFKFIALNHGDMRKENMMVKYAQDGQIENLKFIDFQACWWSTPAHDFLFYLIHSVPIEVVDGQIDTLVDAYWQYLQEALLQWDCSVDYEKSDFLADIEKLHFMFVIWLPGWCVINCSIIPEEVRNISMLPDKECFRLLSKCLDDAQFAEALWGWLLYCEKIEIFDILEKMISKPL